MPLLKPFAPFNSLYIYRVGQINVQFEVAAFALITYFTDKAVRV